MVEFLAEDKFMSAMQYDLIIRCEIDPRATPDIAENPFTITLMDECYDVNISPAASRASYSIDLYFFDMTPFNPAGSSLFSCNTPSHQIRLVSTTAIIPADFTINDGSQMIEVDPQLIENVGIYTFVIEACVEIQFGEQYNCAESSSFTVEIMDSCLKTEIVQILSTPIFDIMQAAQLYTDSINLVDAMGITGWQWTDTLSLQLGEQDKCGRLSYEVVNFNGLPTDLVTLYIDEFGDVTQDYLLFAPTLAHPVGTYNLNLRAYLYYEPSETLVDTRDEPFSVVINNCFAYLDLSLV